MKVGFITLHRISYVSDSTVESLLGVNIVNIDSFYDYNIMIRGSVYRVKESFSEIMELIQANA